MEVSGPEKLDRRMYGHRPDVAEIEQTNDVDGPFVNSPQGIPADLQAMIQDAGRLEVEPKPEKEVSHDVDQIAEENPNSRFRILNIAIKKPGVCFVCRSDGNDERQFVDFGKTVEWYGVVYICTFCVNEVAKILGLGRNENFDQIVAAHNEMVEAYNTLLEESQRMENATRLLLRNCHCEPSVSGESFTPIDVEATQESESNSNDPDESGDVEEFGDLPETSVDDDGESEPEPEKPKRTRRGSPNS